MKVLIVCRKCKGKGKENKYKLFWFSCKNCKGTGKVKIGKLHF